MYTARAARSIGFALCARSVIPVRVDFPRFLENKSCMPAYSNQQVTIQGALGDTVLVEQFSAEFLDEHKKISSSIKSSPDLRVGGICSLRFCATSHSAHHTLNR